MPDLCLELETALAVEKQIFREPCPILAETLVERIVTHCLEPVSDGGEEVVEVGLAYSCRRIDGLIRGWRY
jgi:hypothetical protein